jgi:hypothetical protein
MQPVDKPGLDDTHALEWPGLGAQAACRVRLLGGGNAQLLFARIELNQALEIKIARVSLLIVNACSGCWVGLRISVTG